MALRTARLESEYTKISGHTIRMLDAEKNRVKHMEYLLLQFENDTLQSELDQASEKLVEAIQTGSDTHFQLLETRKEVDHLRGIIKSSSHEIESLRVCVFCRHLLFKVLNSEQGSFASRYGTVSDSKKLYAENANLSKELVSLRSQFEELSASRASSQDIFAQKQGLERQLTTLEVQLADEKRSRERIQARNLQQSQELESLSSQLEKLCKGAVDGSSVKEQERASRQQEHNWAKQRNSLEKEIESLNKKLRSTKDQLKDTQKTQQHRPGNTAAGDANEATPQNRVNPIQRAMSQFNPDLTIATPGAIQTYKGTKQPTALPGDKSAFSITPFLNRTNDQLDQEASSDIDIDGFNAAKAKEADMLPSKDGVLSEDQAVDDQPEKQTMPEKLPRKSSKQKQTQSKSTKPQAKKNQAKRSDNIESDDQLEDFSGMRAQTMNNGLAKPKKRKLGAQRERNIFDEEEDEFYEQRKPGRKPATGTAGRNQSGTQPPAASAMGPLSGKGGFGAFSPLKRDKKRL